MTLADDLLVGAEAIANFLGFTERRVYGLIERKVEVPIRKRAGIGLYALRSELTAWIMDPSTLLFPESP